MTDKLRVILEIGKKLRVVAGAVDWPGLDRWGKSEEDALDKLSSYVPRYTAVAERAGLESAFSRSREVEVIERVPGSSSTDFFGIAHVPSEFERTVLSERDLERRVELLRACWELFDELATLVSAELRPGTRGAGDRAMRSSATCTGPSVTTGPPRSRSAQRRAPCSPQMASRHIGCDSSLPSAPTTPRASSPGSGPSSSSSAAPRSTSWTTPGRWKTETWVRIAELTTLRLSLVRRSDHPYRHGASDALLRRSEQAVERIREAG